MSQPIPEELLLLWRRFQEQAISEHEWTHQAHLQVAIAATRLHGLDAVSLLREGIQKLNARHGIAQTPTGGYHEILTVLWSELARQGIASIPPVDSESLQKLLDVLADKKLPLRFYSRDLLMSWEARTGWVEPDLGPIVLQEELV